MGAIRGRKGMPRDIDLRDHSAYRDANSSASAVSGLAASFSFDTAPGYAQRALAYVQHPTSVLGLEPYQVPEFEGAPFVQQTSSGGKSVHLQQNYKGIPIFQASQSVRFGPDDKLESAAGRIVPIAGDIAATPKMSVESAVRSAAEYLASPSSDENRLDEFGNIINSVSLDVRQFSPKKIASFTDSPEQQTVLEAGPFGDEIKTSLVWAPLSAGLALCWEVELVMPQAQGHYRVLVDASTGRVIYCRQLLAAIAASASVFTISPDTARQEVPMPLPLSEYPFPISTNLPNGFPDDWVFDGATIGNSVSAHFEDAGPPVKGVLDGNKIVFRSTEPLSEEQRVINLFYYSSFMHDFMYQLGFREADGNFQKQDFGRGGTEGDALDARAYNGPVFMTASMSYPIDGISPVMKMGLVQSTGRHTAFDATVIFHEYMHGVTNRLVGGRTNDHALEAPQSAGMGEGWGDYVACTLTGKLGIGAWVTANPRGIRFFPYDSNFPDNFGSVGTGRYVEQHMIGEIWCASMMELGRTIGNQLCLQIVIDALKLSPQNPSFLDMRDAILLALDHKLFARQLRSDDYQSARSGCWKVFAKFGMGPNAKSDGPMLTGIVADFSPPPNIVSTPVADNAPAGISSPIATSVVSKEATPGLAIPDMDPNGVTSSIAMLAQGSLIRLIVSVDIEHTFVGDLRVSLRSPSGTEALLHDRNGFNQKNLIRTYSSDDVTQLASLVGTSIAGDWSLHVADLARLNVGTLRRWGLNSTVKEIPPQA